MKRQIIGAFIAPLAFSFSLWSASAQAPQTEFLYLLSGTLGTEDKLPVKLYRLSARGVSRPSTVMTLAEGLDRVLADHERRRLVIAYPAIAPTAFAVINMDSPGVPRTVDIPYDSNNLLPGAIYLLDVPRRGECVALALGRTWRDPRVPYSQLTVAPLDGPGEHPYELPMESLRFIRITGRVGGGLPDAPNPGVRGDPLHILVADPIGWSLELPQPQYFGTRPATEAYSLVANNDVITVLSGVPDELEVFLKRTREWQRVAMPFQSTRIRAFGKWITAIGQQQGWMASQNGRGGAIVIRQQDQTNLSEIKRKSLGQAKRRSEQIAPKITVDDFFDGVSEVFPGELLVYNAESGVRLQISTHEGDSEVLLVTDDSVYYRVNDELYRVAIINGGLGLPVRIAAGREIFQAHWAFLGPE